MTFGQRVRGVLRLDAMVFEDIEADRDANVQALTVVVLWTLAAGIGWGADDGLSWRVLTREAIGALAGLVMWAVLTWVIGTKLLPEPQTRSSVGELLRVIGFSSAPGFFAVLASIPIPLLGWLVRQVVTFWMLAATVVGVRQALDYKSTGRAFIVVFVGWLFFVILQALL